MEQGGKWEKIVADPRMIVYTCRPPPWGATGPWVIPCPTHTHTPTGVCVPIDPTPDRAEDPRSRELDHEHERESIGRWMRGGVRGEEEHSAHGRAE